MLIRGYQDRYLMEYGNRKGGPYFRWTKSRSRAHLMSRDEAAIVLQRLRLDRPEACAFLEASDFPCPVFIVS